MCYDLHINHRGDKMITQDAKECERPDHEGNTMAGPFLLQCADCESDGWQYEQDYYDDLAVEAWKESRI